MCHALTFAIPGFLMKIDNETLKYYVLIDLLGVVLL